VNADQNDDAALAGRSPDTPAGPEAGAARRNGARRPSPLARPSRRTRRKGAAGPASGRTPAARPPPAADEEQSTAPPARAADAAPPDFGSRRRRHQGGRRGRRLRGPSGATPCAAPAAGRRALRRPSCAGAAGTRGRAEPVRGCATRSRRGRSGTEPHRKSRLGQPAAHEAAAGTKSAAQGRPGDGSRGTRRWPRPTPVAGPAEGLRGRGARRGASRRRAGRASGVPPRRRRSPRRRSTGGQAADAAWLRPPRGRLPLKARRAPDVAPMEPRCGRPQRLSPSRRDGQRGGRTAAAGQAAKTVRRSLPIEIYARRTCGSPPRRRSPSRRDGAEGRPEPRPLW